MKTQSKTVENESLEGVFRAELSEALYAQQRLGKAYTKMAGAASSAELKKVFEGQVQNTTLQVSRMEKCLEMLELTLDSGAGDIISGYIDVIDEVIKEFGEGPVRDTALIATAQKIEHYGISAYGTLRTIATLMGRVQCAQLLEENKDEEAETDELLTKLAMEINQKAFEG